MVSGNLAVVKLGKISKGNDTVASQFNGSCTTPEAMKLSGNCVKIERMTTIAVCNPAWLVEQLVRCKNKRRTLAES